MERSRFSVNSQFGAGNCGCLHGSFARTAFTPDLCAAPLSPRIELLMTTLTATRVPAARRSTGARIFLGLLLILVLLAGGVVGYAYFIARAALPQLDGSIKVNGLSAS